MEAEHRVQNLHRNGSCQIDRCSCGQYHVSIGRMTMHLTAVQFFSVAHAMQSIDWESQSTGDLNL
ncbi:MAG: hypothetical protein CMF59_12485 [Leptospiraceae bacterium]|nr:hypothetical protein [Leptospiraceae bacterium]